MAAISKKSATTKKQPDGVAKSADRNGSPKKSAGKNGSATTAAANQRQVPPDDTGKALSQANEHMERAWEKIYEGRGKSRKAA